MSTITEVSAMSSMMAWQIGQVKEAYNRYASSLRRPLSLSNFSVNWINENGKSLRDEWYSLKRQEIYSCPRHLRLKVFGQDMMKECGVPSSEIEILLLENKKRQDRIYS